MAESSVLAPYGLIARLPRIWVGFVLGGIVLVGEILAVISQSEKSREQSGPWCFSLQRWSPGFTGSTTCSDSTTRSVLFQDTGIPSLRLELWRCTLCPIQFLLGISMAFPNRFICQLAHAIQIHEGMGSGGFGTRIRCCDEGDRQFSGCTYAVRRGGIHLLSDSTSSECSSCAGIRNGSPGL